MIHLYIGFIFISLLKILSLYPSPIIKHSKSSSTESITIHNKKFIPLISEEMLHKRIKELGNQITKDLESHITKEPQEKGPLLICILKGAVFFYADLIKAMPSLNVELDFLKISSYGNATRTSGEVKMVDGLSTSLTNRDIIIVEDIIDTGQTMIFLRNLISKQHPKSLRIATLLKKSHVKLDFPVDYVGFEVGSDFLVGYGLDYFQKGRNLSSIYILASE